MLPWPGPDRKSEGGARTGGEGFLPIGGRVILAANCGLVLMDETSHAFTLRSPLPVAEAIRDGAAALAEAGIDGPRLEARLLLAEALGEAPARLLLDPARLVETAPYAALLARRAAHEPLALILGRREFWSLEFEVSPATLIPRADSETLVEAALEARPARAGVASVLDLGTGTGCLLLACLSEFPGAWGLGVDRSAAACALAARNAARLGLAGRAGFVCADWDAPLAGRFDLVLSNPPYIESAVIAGLMPEVALHEPRSALDGGVDGMDCTTHVITRLPHLLAPGGVAVIELGVGQARAARHVAVAAGFEAATVRADLGGVARALVLRAP